MNIETVYSLLIGSGWFFLAAWALLLLVASAVVFWDRSPKQTFGFAQSRTPAIYLGRPGGLQESGKLKAISARQ
jgi:hypothetical protein